MDDAERERLKIACRACREMECAGEQLLLVKLEDVEELLRLDAMVNDILSITKKLDEMSHILKAEVGNETNSREESGDCTGAEKP